MTATYRPAQNALSAMFRGALVALGASIPISVAADNVLYSLVVFAWIASGRVATAIDDARRQPIVLFAWLWLAVHLVGAVYSNGDTHDVWRSVGKAAAFVMIPAATALLDRPRDRELALHAFMAAIALTVVLSYLRWVRLIGPDAPPLKLALFSPTVVFKYHLTQNLLLALGAFVFAVQAMRVKTRAARLTCAVAACATAINVLFVGDGRTGQVVLVLLIVYFGAWRMRTRGAAIAAAVAAALLVAAYATPQSALHRRADLAIAEARTFEDQPAVSGNSTGQRLEFYTKSLEVIGKHPLIGVGTGGFAAAYEEQVRGSASRPTRNPHNEYLLKGVELGIAGILLLIALYAVVWRAALRLPDPGHRAIARGLVITFAAASLTASTLSDHTEGFLFVWLAGVLFSSCASAAAGEGVETRSATLREAR